MYYLIDTIHSEVLEDFEDQDDVMDYFYGIDYYGAPIPGYDTWEPFYRDITFWISAYGLRLVSC